MLVAAQSKRFRVRHRGALGVALAGMVLFATGAAVRTQPAQLESDELFRIRLQNRTNGAIEVSVDAGETWERIGRVVHPARALQTAGPLFEACPAGAVAGVECDAIPLRVPSLAEAPRLLAIAAVTGRPLPHQIVTSIPAGGCLFRSLAPPRGSLVYLRNGDLLETLPLDYQPRLGDELVLIAASSRAWPSEIVIENRGGGAVTAIDRDGQSQPVGRVKQPLRGIGRYAGTERAGEGSVVAWHPLTVTVATAGRRRLGSDGRPLPELGGFVIQPAEANLHGATHPASQLLIEAAREEGDAAPPFARFFQLQLPVSSGVAADLAPTRVEIRVDDSDWIPMPDLRGPLDEAALRQRLASVLGRAVERGITHLRIVAARPSPEIVRLAARLGATPLRPEAIQRGIVEIAARPGPADTALVVISIDGAAKALLSSPPFVWKWDTTTVANGEHLVEVRAYDAQNVVVSATRIKILVDN